MSWKNLVIGLLAGLVLPLAIHSCAARSMGDTLPIITEKYKGVNFTGTSYQITDFSSFDSLKLLGCDWVSFTPFSYMHAKNNPHLADTFPRQWYGESRPGIREQIDSAHARGLKVMVKPHIWIVGGGFTGDIDFSSDSKWIEWQNSYATHILDYAKLCEEKGADMLCIGNELKNPVRNSEAFWNALIDSIRMVYKGKLTYAANWDNYEQIPFWDKLDVIGINAYFPLSSKKDPTSKEVEKGWAKWKSGLRKLKSKTQKPIVFTELGYRAAKYCCDEPWDYSKKQADSDACQAEAYRAFFNQSFGQEVDGVFIWKYFDHNDRHHHRDRYSPQGRKALAVIESNFKAAAR